MIALLSWHIHQTAAEDKCPDHMTFKEHTSQELRPLKGMTSTAAAIVEASWMQHVCTRGVPHHPEVEKLLEIPSHDGRDRVLDGALSKISFQAASLQHCLC